MQMECPKEMAAFQAHDGGLILLQLVELTEHTSQRMAANAA